MSGNASDVTCDFAWCVAGGRWAIRDRCVVAGRDGADGRPPLEGAAVVACEVSTWTSRGVVSAGVGETTTGWLTAGALGIETRGLTSACGAGSGDG
ncbi:MAG: hypothetical protein ACLP0L_16825 [Solirubrobacteraceae bacterium]